jgi:glyoxylase-like metal-dependent hydrolase (beta-lactamase superfamily II)
MLKRILIGLGGLVVLAIIAGAAGLTWAHLAIRRERATLPPLAAVAAAEAERDAPVRLSVINTASQVVPRSGVLDSSRDPRPSEPSVMSFPSFVLEWIDGRMLLIDVGMTRDGAIAFGALTERLGGAGPIAPHTSVAERLGDARQRVQGIIFTHLHTDHTGGIGDLCAGLSHPVRVFMTAAQAERPNYTTRPGLKLVQQASCAQPEILNGGPLIPVPGFPGVWVIAAGGHTPGSQIIVAYVHAPEGARRFAFVGDIVNNIDGITYNISKPFLYRWLIVPEDNQRLDELRQYLRALRDTYGVALLVSHDQQQLETSGLPPWKPQPLAGGGAF